MPRYMILIKASPEAENPTSTGPEIFEEMTTFNEELHAAGSTYSMDGPAQVTKGPFDVMEEGHVCGWWILKTKDGEETVSWAKKIPFKEGEVTVRKIAELDDLAIV
ncbi:dgpfaetke family [Fusarium pseudoanthophilum]|uniref:Dgpfaetke family n=1 Tax=Fusarium pseudoanthophilum TaxID=48495 RepID=A0A8H5PTN0_9HYPO|nr:dgpfaetke family [Fusarium pseudoanthophilum]